MYFHLWFCVIGLQSFQLLLGKSVWIEERLETHFGEESSSSGRFNPGLEC